jgi:hypothetical protein
VARKHDFFVKPTVNGDLGYFEVFSTFWPLKKRLLPNLETHSSLGDGFL